MCELKVPVKIGFVAVYLVMNSFLMTPPRRLQEISCCLLRNPWTLWILNACQHGFLWWTGLWLSLLFHLRPKYCGGNEDNGDLLPKIPCTHCWTQYPWPCSKPPPTHTSTRDSWTLTGKSGSVSFGDTAPFSWALVCTRFCLCPPRVCFPNALEVL